MSKLQGQVKVQNLADLVKERMLDGENFVIVVDGPGASGKSTVARSLAKLLAAQVIEGDDFYWPEFDPDGLGGDFDWKRLRDQVLLPLSESQPVRYQQFDWDSFGGTGVKAVSSNFVSVETPGCVIVEGVYSLRSELRDLNNFSIWVEAP